MPYRGTLEICQEIADLQGQKNEIEHKMFGLRAEVEDITGMDYDEFIEGMRRLMAPA